MTEGISVAVNPELEGLNPYDLHDAEAVRVDAFLSGLDDADWAAPTRCGGWTIRDLVAHLAATQEYHQACLDDSLGELMARGLEAGATDLDSFNAWGVENRADASADEVVAEWRAADAEIRRRFRERDGTTLATMVGQYPVRAQAFHIASELAVHADDLGTPVEPADQAARLDWRTRFARATLAEEKPEITVEVVPGGTRIRSDAFDAVLDDTTLVEARNARLSDDDPVDPVIRASLSPF